MISVTTDDHIDIWSRDATNIDFHKALDHIASNLPGFLYQLLMKTDGQFVYSYVSESVQDMFGVSRAEVEADASVLLNMIHPDDYDWVVKESMEYGLALKQWHAFFRMVLRDGQVIWIEARDTPRLLDGGSILWTGYANDVTRQKEMEERLKHMAHHDLLTELPNRILFNEVLQQALNLALRNKTRAALLFIDLDRFKPINDAFGHATGDVLLQQFAQRIRSSIRDSDIAGRIGGDEFIVALPSIQSEADALLAATKLQSTLSRPFSIDGNNLEITSSIGIAIYPEHGNSVEELQNNADRAMYLAKKSNHDRVKLYMP